jgi:hypothetical protein
VDDRQKERLARNEDFFRSVNEEIQSLAERHGTDSHEYDFICECSDTSCTEKVRLTLTEYEHVRADPSRFVVAKGHILREIERVVKTAEDHAVIEKHGHAGVIAIELDKKNDD